MSSPIPRLDRGGLCLCAAALLMGCAAGSSPFEQELYEQATLSADQLRELITAPRRPQSEEPVEIPQDASVEQYVRLALAHNPQIRAARQRVARLAQRIPQVTSLQDPMLHISPFGEMAQTAAGQVGLMTALTQKLPFPGKLETRGRIAAQEVVMAAAELKRTRLEVIARARRAYWSLYEAARSIEVARENLELVKRFVRIARAKYEAGLVSQADVLRAMVEVDTLRKKLHTFRRDRATAEAMLNRLLDREVGAGVPTPPLAPPARPPEDSSLELSALLSKAAEANPRLTKLHARIEKFRQKLKLARLQYWPDLTLGAHYNVVREEGLVPHPIGQDMWWVSFGINLPIWLDKREAAKKEALRGILESIAKLDAVSNRVAFKVREALERVTTHRHHIALLRNEIIPQARQAVEVSLAGYQAGTTDLLTVIENWQRLLRFELMLHEHRALLGKALADLRQAVGVELERITPDGKSPNQTPEEPSNPTEHTETEPQP